MLVVTKSLCEYVSNRVQYGECSISRNELLYNIIIINEYIYIYIYIYIIHGKYSATLGFMKFLAKKQLPDDCCFAKNFMKPRVAEYFPWIKYTYI